MLALAKTVLSPIHPQITRVSSRLLLYMASQISGKIWRTRFRFWILFKKIVLRSCRVFLRFARISGISALCRAASNRLNNTEAKDVGLMQINNFRWPYYEVAIKYVACLLLNDFVEKPQTYRAKSVFSRATFSVGAALSIPSLPLPHRQLQAVGLSKLRLALRAIPRILSFPTLQRRKSSKSTTTKRTTLRGFYVNMNVTSCRKIQGKLYYMWIFLPLKWNTLYVGNWRSIKLISATIA